MTVFVSKKGCSPSVPPSRPMPGLLEAAERDAEVGAERVVADRAGAQLAGDVPGPLHVVGEDGRVEPVDRVVGDGDGVLLVLRRDHAQHRPEDLLLGDRRGVVDVAEDGRLNEPAPVEVLRPAAAGGQRGSLRHALGDVALDPVTLPLGDQGAHVGLGVERVADLHLGEDAGQGLDELVVAVLADDDPRQRGADLSGEEALGAGQRGGRGGQVHVVEDDGGGLAAQLQGAAGDPLPAEWRRSAARRPSTR